MHANNPPHAPQSATPRARSSLTGLFRKITFTAALLSAAVSQAVVVSYVDTSLSGSQKFMRIVDGKPYWGTEIQIRFDKLRYNSDWQWGATGRSKLVVQAKSDGFNTLAVPIHWYEIEPSKDSFNWSILDDYLTLCKNNGMRVELLWFSQNSGGKVQWLGDPARPVHLRTPDYVLWSSSPSSQSTTSNYTILRSVSNYTLDLKDTNLRSRETYVVSQLMAHIASWDAANGSPHTVIGMQLGNEAYTPYTGTEQVAYYSAVASAVKSSSYVIWTRLNDWTPHSEEQTTANEALRNNGGTNIDFVGDDTYGSGENPTWMTQAVPPNGKNYQMMMELGAEVSIVPQLCLSLLSANTALAYYDICSSDGHSMYDRTGFETFTAHGSYVNTIRTINRLLTSDVVDVARLKAQSSSGLFVHNWAGNSTVSTTGVSGVVFMPSSSTSQAISLARSSTEIVLMNTLGGTFTYPSSLQVSGASRGYFDSNNTWVDQGSVSFTSTSMTPPAGTTVRLTLGGTPPPTTTYYTFHNAATGLCIDGMGATTAGSDCGQWASSGSTNQQWALVASGSNFRLQNRATGLYLDGMGRTTNGSFAGQYTSSTSTNQQWIKSTSGSYVRFQNVATGLYLDGLGSTTNGASLGQWSSSTSSNQLWSQQ